MSLWMIPLYGCYTFFLNYYLCIVLFTCVLSCVSIFFSGNWTCIDFIDLKCLNSIFIGLNRIEIDSIE